MTRIHRAKPARSPRQATAYEEVTEDKLAMGARLKEAREIAGLTQEQAAEELQYSQQVQLSLFESGQRYPPARVIRACAVLYGTTTDYLFGLVDDSDRDPAAGMIRMMEARIFSESQRQARQWARLSVDVVRDILPTVMDGINVARSAVELAELVGRFRLRNINEFDDMPVGSAMAGKCEATLAVAMAYTQRVERAKRLLSARSARMTADGDQLSMIPALDLI